MSTTITPTPPDDDWAQVSRSKLTPRPSGRISRADIDFYKLISESNQESYESLFKVFAKSIDQDVNQSFDSIDRRMTAIENSMAAMSGSLLNLSVSATNSQPKSYQELDELKSNFESMQNEVQRMKTEDLPAAKRVGELFVDQADFMVAAVSAKGLYEGLSSKVDSIENRVNAIEQNRNKAWDRRYAFITVTIAIAGIIVGAIVTYFATP